MTITDMEKIDNKKFKVYIDYEFVFVLYVTDIRKNGLKTDQEITPEKYEEILNDTVLRRAKQKSVAIIKYMDRTEKELRNKLKENMYTQNIIDKAIEYIKSCGYIDDVRYAFNYSENKKSQKSRQQIIMELVKRGISKEIIEEAVKEVSDETAIKRAIRKKTDDIEGLSFEKKQKIAAYLYRKGFKSEDIKKSLSL